MILFVNVFITNRRLVPGIYELAETRRHGKLDVFKYMLSSYAVIPWTRVFINYELDDPFLEFKEETDRFIRGLFPNNLVLRNRRIASYPEWKSALDELNEENDDWIWLTCNDDHVFIDSDLHCLEEVLAFASDKAKSHRHVAVLPSHWHEFIALKRRNRLLKRMRSPLIAGPFGEGDILDDRQECFATTHKTTISIQIVNKALLNYWFSKPDLLPQDLRRTDGIQATPEDQISIIPYRELARHFDGYSHSKVPLQVVPVMMIPDGFFDGAVNIQYGFEKRTKGFVWIHPLKQMIPNELVHSERATDEKCDMNILLEDIPLFWRGNVKQVRRQELDPQLVRSAYVAQKLSEICADPRLGFFPMGAAIEHYRKIFKAKYDSITSDEVCDTASNVWTFKNYLLWVRTALPYLGSSRLRVLKGIWFVYGILVLIRKPKKMLEVAVALINDPRRILKISYKKNERLLDEVIRADS